MRPRQKCLLLGNSKVGKTRSGPEEPHRRENCKIPKKPANEETGCENSGAKGPLQTRRQGRLPGGGGFEEQENPGAGSDVGWGHVMNSGTKPEQGPAVGTGALHSCRGLPCYSQTSAGRNRVRGGKARGEVNLSEELPRAKGSSRVLSSAPPRTAHAASSAEGGRAPPPSLAGPFAHEE